MRRSPREVVMEMLRFGKVKSFVSGLLTKSVGVEIEADAGEPSAKDSELWAHAPLLYAPAAPSATDAVSDAEHCEALFYQLGDERVVIATKDRRWQISVAEGEVVLRSMGPGTPAYLHLKPDGTAILSALVIKLTSDSATQSFIRGESFQTAFNTWKTALGVLLTAISTVAGTAVENGTYATASTAMSTALAAALSTRIKGE